jgi:heme/copper-type cytochrome/quinol oxidase subunit 2
MWTTIRERLALASVILVLVGLPSAIYYYQKIYIPSKYPENAQIVDLYGIAEDGRWVAKPVNGATYWWKNYERADMLHVDKERPVVLRVTSTDVLHSFAIPSIREYRRPVDVEAGKWKVFELMPEEGDELSFLCWQYCSDDHTKMNGNIMTGGIKIAEATLPNSSQ